MSYFQHDTDAINDPKITALISEHGGLAYGIFWRIVELLHDEENHKLQKKNYIYSALAQQMSTNAEQIKSIIKSAIECEIFYEDEEFIWSKRVFKNIEKRNDISIKRSEAGKISALKRTNAEQMSTNAEQMSTIKEKEIKEKESKKDKKELPPLPPDNIIKEYFLNVVSDQAIALQKNINDIDNDKVLIDFNKCLNHCKDKHATTKKKSYNWKNQVNNWVDITKYKNYNNNTIAAPAQPEIVRPAEPEMTPERLAKIKENAQKVADRVINYSKYKNIPRENEQTAKVPNEIDKFCANFGI